jgi:hypothetical protein
MRSGNTKVLVVFVDALGPQQLERFGDRLAGLKHRKPLGGVLGYSSGALATILTGAAPAAHGRMCLFTASPPGRKSILAPLSWLGLLPKILHERAALRRLVGRALSKVEGLTGYVALHRVPPEAFEWLDIPERDDLFQAPDVGGVPTFLAEARRAGLSVFAAPWQLPEQERWALSIETLARGDIDLAFLYATELDAALHMGGNDGRQAAAAIERIGANIERARDAMRRGGGDVVTLLIGDHGMADVRTFVDPRPFTEKGSARAFVDSTMMRFWGDDASLDHARAALERGRIPGTWLDTAALKERNAPTAGDPYGRAMFLLDEGVIFAPSFVGGRVRGMHGYDVSSKSARAALASDAEIPEGCSNIADLAGLIRGRLGVAA